MTKYLKYFPDPFLDDLVAGRCVPFVGAGFSRNAKIPSGEKMPLWDELGNIFAENIKDYSYPSAIDALSAYEHEYSRPKLVEKLHQVLLVDSAQPGSAHTAFCELPFELCVTTNFEFLLERSYGIVNRYCRPIIDEDQLSVGSNIQEVKLLKLHGDLHHPNRLVVTEQDYDGFIGKYPLISTFLANLLIVKTALFIGYSLDDPDFRQVWQILGDRLGKLRRLAYTISVSASAHTIARFERRGVKVINIPGKHSNYPKILETIFKELREYWSETLLETSTSTEDDSLAELTLPKRPRSRLCFFSVPSRLSAYYKSVVFPIAEKHGFAPVIAMDVISPGDSIAAKVSALIDRAELIVADVSSRNTELEYQMALSRKHERMAIIVEEGSKVPSDFSNRLYLVRPKGSESASEEFKRALDSWFAQVAADLRPELAQEPERLLKKKEYRAAIISAITLLENEIRRRLTEDIQETKLLFLTMNRVIERAINQEIITAREAGQIREWVFIRNQAVHLGVNVTAKQARSLVKGVLKIINRIGY